MSNPLQTLRLGTRGSLLARTQSAWVARELETHNPGLRVELVTVQTSGDRITDRPLHAFGGKGLFTKELEQALLAGTVDFAVHSFKDVPVTMPLVDVSDLVIASVPPREDPRDAWVGRPLASLAELPAGLRIGTGSLRRQSQLLDQRPDFVIESIRGNIDTRLRKQQGGEYDVVILAMAGLKRASLLDAQRMSPIPPDVLLPAAGQGALALQCRGDREDVRRILSSINDPTTATCVEAERAVVLGLKGDCRSPIAAYATIANGQMRLQVAVGARDGHPPVLRAEATGAAVSPARITEQVLAELRGRGVEAHLHGRGSP